MEERIYHLPVEYGLEHAKLEPDIGFYIALARRWRSGRLQDRVYHAPDQRATVRYLYDEFSDSGRPSRFISDYEGHIYYPRELELLFRMTGFSVESAWGDYQQGELKDRSRVIVMVGAKESQNKR